MNASADSSVTRQECLVFADVNTFEIITGRTPTLDVHFKQKI